MALHHTTAALPRQGAPAPLNQDSLNGRVTGALFFIGFGAVWMALGLLGMHRGTVAALLFLATVLLALLAMCVWLFRVARGLAPGNMSAEQVERSKRMFTAVNIIQWVSVFAAIIILNVLHRPDYIAPTIALIVGLHLFPLAQSFHYRQHHITGVLLVLWSLACIALVPHSRVAAVCSLGVGVVLLGSAASTLLRCALAPRGGNTNTLQSSTFPNSQVSN